MKYIVNIIVIVLIVALFFALIQFKKGETYGSIHSKISQFFSQLINITKQNIKMQTAPQRKPRLTNIEIETGLIGYMPEVFGNFNELDWQNFWALIYEPIKEKKGFFQVRTYRTKDEIEKILAKRYPKFVDFTEDQWKSFWDVVRISWTEEEKEE
jgi:hypothetical protein